MIQESKAVITKFKARSNSVVFYPSFELFGTNRGQNKASRENLADNKVKGYLSVKSSARIRDLVENWINACKADQIKTKKSLDQYLCFVTLTLPSMQIHSDKQLKRDCLNKFLIYAKRKLKVKNFIWKAEPQKNGNIHFHIIFDRFCSWRLIRKVWIDTLQPLGYIDNFAQKHGHRNPNCTDVMSLEKDKKGEPIKFIGAYMAKYMSKKEKGNGEKDRPIDGRIWGCSDNLKLLEPFSGFDDYLTDKFFKSLQENSNLKQIDGDYFRVFRGNWFEVASENLVLMRKIHEFYLDQYRKINCFDRE